MKEILMAGLVVAGLANCCGMPYYPRPDALANLGPEPKFYWIPPHWAWDSWESDWVWTTEAWQVRPHASVEAKIPPDGPAVPDPIMEEVGTISPWWSIFWP